MAKILILDDHPLFAEAVEREVCRMKPDSQCARANTLADALTLLRLGQFDMALTDLKLPDANGLMVVEALRRERPGMKIAIISAYEDVRLIREAYRMEVVGYLAKGHQPDSFGRGLELLLSGGFYYAPEMLEPARAAGPHGLTPREQDVLDQLVRGMTSKQIAKKLGLAPATVDKHVEQIRVKMGARSRIQLLAKLADLDGVVGKKK